MEAVRAQQHQPVPARTVAAGADVEVVQYLKTPLDRAEKLSTRFGNEILLKREDLQPVFSFKLRGAYNKIAQLSPEEAARGHSVRDDVLSALANLGYQRSAAEKAAQFVGLRPTEDLIEELERMGPGQALLRDVRGRIAPIQVIEALDDRLHVAFDTHPGGDERTRQIRQRDGEVPVGAAISATGDQPWEQVGEDAG